MRLTLLRRLFLFAFCGLRRRLGSVSLARLCGHVAFRLLAVLERFRLGVEHRLGGGGRSSGFLFRLGPAYGDIFATGNARCFIFAAGDRHGDRYFDFRMESQRHLVLTDRLDRCIEHDLRTANIGAASL